MNNLFSTPTRPTFRACIALIALAIGSTASASDLRGDPRPDVQAFLASTSPEEILERTNDFVSAMTTGDFGNVTKRHQNAADEASDTINDLLAPGDDFSALDAEQLARLNLARDNLTKVMMYYHPDRIVCTSVQRIGTRVQSKECVTVAQALARKRTARDLGNHLINGPMCVPGEGQDCVRGN